jgi:DNA-binding helix-hairpin-helix protein with protein kinase domain
LQAYGIDDASDVTQWLQIKGIGPKYKQALLDWRWDIERRFVFNPNELVDTRALDQKIAQKRTVLERSLSTGPQQLQQALLPWQERTRLISTLDTWARQIAQADANLKALNSI